MHSFHVACPKCGAQPGEACVPPTPGYHIFHRERVYATPIAPLHHIPRDYTTPLRHIPVLHHDMGHDSTWVSSQCLRDNHSICFARDCHCTCGHGVGTYHA